MSLPSDPCTHTYCHGLALSPRYLCIDLSVSLLIGQFTNHSLVYPDARIYKGKLSVLILPQHPQ